MRRSLRDHRGRQHGRPDRSPDRRRRGSDLAYDRDPKTLAACGIDPAGSIPELVAAVDVVLLSLPDSTVIEPVALGPGGLAECARRGQVIVDLSTAAPDSTIRIQAALAAAG